MKITPEQTIPDRITVIETVLANVLNRGSAMHVGPDKDPGTLYVWVRGQDGEQRDGFSLHTLAREIELELS